MLDLALSYGDLLLEEDLGEMEPGEIFPFKDVSALPFLPEGDLLLESDLREIGLGEECFFFEAKRVFGRGEPDTRDRELELRGDL